MSLAGDVLAFLFQLVSLLADLSLLLLQAALQQGQFLAGLGVGLNQPPPFLTDFA